MLGAGEMGQQFRVHAALAEDTSSLAQHHGRWLGINFPAPGDLTPSSGLLRDCIHMYTLPNTYIHTKLKIKYLKIKLHRRMLGVHSVSGKHIQP